MEIHLKQFFNTIKTNTDDDISGPQRSVTWVPQIPRLDYPKLFKLFISTRKAMRSPERDVNYLSSSVLIAIHQHYKNCSLDMSYI